MFFLAIEHVVWRLFIEEVTENLDLRESNEDVFNGSFENKNYEPFSSSENGKEIQNFDSDFNVAVHNLDSESSLENIPVTNKIAECSWSSEYRQNGNVIWSLTTELIDP